MRSSPPAARSVCWLFLLLAAMLPASTFAQDAASAPAAATSTAAVERVGRDIEFLASDALEGRAVGTPGIATAADFIRREFQRLGLTGGAADGGYYQHFPMRRRGVAVVPESTSLTLQGPNGESRRLVGGEQFQALSIGGSGEAAGELYFLGYGVSSPSYRYDEFADADLAGKIVVIIRHEPGQGDEKSVFNGARLSPHAYLATKLRLLHEHKAAAVLMVNDRYSVPNDADDDLSPADGFGGNGAAAWMPFFQVKTAEIDGLLARQPLRTAEGGELASVAAVEKYIDETMKPVNQPLKGWSARAAAAFTPNAIDAFNVVGVLEGEGPLADETIVIGAHYDHIGLGGAQSRAPGRREIHNGADDNATGTAGVVELARRFAARGRKPSRRLVFIAFSGEESGLVGSGYYCRNPLFPLEKTAAMINFDMIGRLRNNKVTVYGVGTAKEFRQLTADAIAGSGLTLNAVDSSEVGSDHLPFSSAGVPVLFFHTGIHAIFHTPEDDYETINVPGTVQVVDYAESVVDGVLDLPQAPEFASTSSLLGALLGAVRTSRAYLGIRPNYNDTTAGLLLEDVISNSPAASAGLLVGDAIQTLDGKKITTLSEMQVLMGSKRPGDEVEIVFTRRGGEARTLRVKLGETPR